MKKNSLAIYLILLASISASIILVMYFLGPKAIYLAQLYMLAPAIAAILTRLFFYSTGFSDAFLQMPRLKHIGQFWALSLLLTLLSFSLFTITGAISWDISGTSFLNNLEKQFALSGQSMEDSLPGNLTAHQMLTIFFLGNLTLFNIFPGLITGMGEEFGHRGMMFWLWSKKNIFYALIGGGAIWFLWHVPLMFVLPLTHQFTPSQHLLNGIITLTGTICSHIYFSFILVRTKSIWIAALAHITFNNASAALAFFVVIQNQLLANTCLTLTMTIVVTVGMLTGVFKKTFQSLQPVELSNRLS